MLYAFVKLSLQIIYWFAFFLFLCDDLLQLPRFANWLLYMHFKIFKVRSKTFIEKSSIHSFK